MTVASIVTNVAAQNAAASARKSLESVDTFAKQLSTGLRITSAKYDPAGLSIGIGLETDKNTLEAALNSTAQAQAILKIADGGLENTSKILSRMKQLAVQANSGAMGDSEKSYIQKELNALGAQLDSVVATTKFNGTKLLDGQYADKVFQIGLDSSTDTISVTINNGTSGEGFGQAHLGVDTTSTLDVTASGGATAASSALDSAIAIVKGARAEVGALQSRFQYAADGLEVSIQNTAAARAEYLDADYAAAATALAAAQVQNQSAIAALAQVNNLPQTLLRLVN